MRTTFPRHFVNISSIIFSYYPLSISINHCSFILLPSFFPSFLPSFPPFPPFLPFLPSSPTFLSSSLPYFLPSSLPIFLSSSILPFLFFLPSSLDIFSTYFPSPICPYLPSSFRVVRRIFMKIYNKLKQTQNYHIIPTLSFSSVTLICHHPHLLDSGLSHMGNLLRPPPPPLGSQAQILV